VPKVITVNGRHPNKNVHSCDSSARILLPACLVRENLVLCITRAGRS
jgi:hypothetical protein